MRSPARPSPSRPTGASRLGPPALLLLLVVLGAGCQCEVEQRAPYLQQVCADQAVLVWRDPAPEAVTAELTRDGEPVATQSSSPDLQREVRFRGLAPDTAYTWRIPDPGGLPGGTYEGWFRTPPAPGTGSLRLWVVGDSGTGEAPQREVLEAMEAATATRPPGALLHLGDVAYERGWDSEFQAHFFEPYADLLGRIATWPAYGNHEARSSDAGAGLGPYFSAFAPPTGGECGGEPSRTEAYYSADLGPVHAISLDSTESALEPMLDWLEADLARVDPAQFLVVFFHHPPYSKGSHDSDREARLVEMREAVVPVLEAAGVDLVLSGHSHAYERTFLVHGAYDTPTTAGDHVLDSGDGSLLGDGPYTKVPGGPGTVYVVAGHGGREVELEGRHPLMAHAEAAYGSVVLDVRPGTLRLWNLDRAGQVTDRFTLIKGEALVLATPRAGGRLTAGEPQTLEWFLTDPADDPVRIEFSADGGETWETVAEAAPGTGRYEWTVPDQPTEVGLVRVTSTRRPALWDVPDAPFVIE